MLDSPDSYVYASRMFNTENPEYHATYVRDLTPGDVILWNGTMCEVHEAFHNGTGWVLFLSEGIGDVYTLAYKVVNRL